MTPSRTRLALDLVAGPLRVRLTAAGVAGGLGALALVLGIAAWVVRLGLVRTPLWVLAAWTLGALGAIAVAGLAWRERRRLAVGPLARAMEREGAWRTGAIGGFLEPAAESTSADLFGAADGVRAGELAARGTDAARPVAARLGKLFRAGAVALGAGLLALAAAGPARGPVSLLWQPAQAWAMVVAPLQLRADRTVVAQGGTVRLTLVAAGRQRATLWTRSPGTTWRPEEVGLDSLGRATRELGPLDGDVYAHVTSGSRASDTLAITVRRPVFLASLTLTARYPAYLGIEDEPVPVGGDTLLLPAGTRLEARGEATARLGEAAWDGPGGRVRLSVDGMRFLGTLTPRASGAFRLMLRTADGAPLGGDEIVVPVRLAADLPPEVEIAVPAGDTTVTPDQPLALVADAQDDHGLTALVLERALRRGGTTQALPEQAMPLPSGRPDRAIVPAALDLATLGLQPGDTLRIAVRARDNSPARQSGRSRELAVAIPTARELRVEQRDQSAAIARQLDSLVAASREAQRQSEDLGRSRQRGDQGQLGFEEAKRAEAVAEQQRDLLRDAEAARKALDELERATRQAGLADSAWLERLQEVREQLEKALTPELRQRLAELQEALRNLDPARARDAIQKLSESQQQLREALERSRELFKRAALEGELTALEREAKEVKEAQRQLTEQLAASDSARAAGQEQRLAQRTDTLAQGLEQAAKQLAGERTSEQLQQTAEQARQAARTMRQAADAARGGRRQQARQAGRQAESQMQQVEREVGEQRDAQQEAWRQEVLEALDRALLETTRLAERQLAVTEQFRRAQSLGQARGEQGAIEEGVQKLLDQVAAASGKNALVSPQILAALAAARQEMRRAREAAASATGNTREAAAQAGEAVDALNVAAFGLLRSRQDVSGAASGSGFAEAVERMQQLANQQGQLSQDGSGLLPLSGMPSFQQQVQALAARQRALAQELERLRAEGQLDPRQLGEEARDLARTLEAGRLDRETIARQERLFRRMLDAGRTLQGQEEDEQKERQSETARPGEIRLPPALRAELLGRDGTIRLPTWEELQRLSPEERRLVTDYFRRLAAGGGAGGKP